MSTNPVASPSYEQLPPSEDEGSQNQTIQQQAKTINEMRDRITTLELALEQYQLAEEAGEQLEIIVEEAPTEERRPPSPYSQVARLHPSLTQPTGISWPILSIAIIFGVAVGWGFANASSIFRLEDCS